METEIWKNLKGGWEVSNLGKIKSNDRFIKTKKGGRNKKGKLLNPGLNKNGYYRVSLFHKKQFLLHRLILEAFTGEVHKYADHINGISTDNRLENLRWCTHMENMANQKKKRAKNKYKGSSLVYKNKSGKEKWRSYIVIKYKQINLGLYDTEIEAAKAYDVAAIKYYKKFARLNFPIKISTL